MRLIKADCMSYRRFRSMAEMDLDRDLVCIVGPNAAGKSSFLEALTHLDHGNDFEAPEVTRNPAPSTATQVRARFVLEGEDKALLEDIPEAREARQFVVWKKNGHGVQGRLDPAPERDAQPRDEVLQRLRSLGDDSWFGARDERDDEEEVDHEERHDTVFAAAIGALESNPTDLSPDEIASLSAVLSRVQRGDDLPYRYRGLPQRLENLIRYEGQDHPHARAIQRLLPRKPRFLLFTDDARELGARYDLNGEYDEAILNLLRLAGTSWNEARTLVRGGDAGRKTAWLDSVTARLAETITADWGQSELTIRVHLDGSVLTLLLRMQTHDFLDIDQQSDGLRQFVALRAFVALENEAVKPIILIDEAETHLHYDAQADLVQVLEQQTEAAKVIYTTHSAGCLPHDLGTGVRAIVPEEIERDGRRDQTDHSRIINKFWTLGPGYSPLLIAMGAGAFAFSAAQRAVIGEGMSEAILMPTLLREATAEDKLSYQVAPHFAEVGKNDVPNLDLVAARVAFVADGDEGGRAHFEKLLRNGVLEEQVIFLGNSAQSGLSLEDLLVREVYLDAVNAELARWHSELTFPANELPDTGRSKAVADWCERQTSGTGDPVQLSKVDVAQRVLDQRHDRPQLLAPQQRGTLRDLHANIENVLSQSTTRLGRTT